MKKVTEMKNLFFFRSISSNTANNDQISPPSTDKQVSCEKTMDKSVKNKHGPEDQVFGCTPCSRRSLSFSSGCLYDSVKVQNGNQTGRQTRSNMVWNSHRPKKFDCDVSRAHSDLSEISSYCSSNVSTILERYIDGEQQMFENGNGALKRPPRVQFTAPTVSRDAGKQNFKSQSFRESRSLLKDGADSGYCNESPRKLAKDDVERLSQSERFSKMRSQEFDNHDNPITIEDIYGKNFKTNSDAYTDEASPKKCSTGWHTEEILEKDENIDMELYKKFKEAEDRARILSEEFQKGNFPFQYRELSVPALLQTIGTITEEKVNMALEVSSVLEDLLAEKAFFREKLKLGKVELDSRTLKLEEEKNEMQLSLEKELDSRSTEWSQKLEKLKAELSIQAKDATEENRYLQKTLSEIEEKAMAAVEERDCVRRSYEEKATECKDMHRSISRLQRTCSEQAKTIGGLQGLCEAHGKKISQEQFDFGTTKLQAEYVRLTGVEHALRKEVDSCRCEVDSLWRENIYLRNRLRNDGKEGAFSTFKLDRELENRVGSLESRIVPLLVESSQLGRMLIDYVKGNGGFIEESGQGCFDGQVIVECEVKLQGLERAAENVMNSVWTVSSILQEKTTPSWGDESEKRNEQKAEDINRAALKAETLLTRLLRDKLYSMELDEEQMQAELAAAVRGKELQMMKKEETLNELRGDLQECKKELGVVRGILPKVFEERDMLWEEVKQYSEENMRLNSEMKVLRKQIDMLCEEVKQYSEEIMRLNSEMKVLRKQVDELDEDILVKEGQINILRDSLAKPFDLLGSPESTNNIYWRG